MNKIPKQKNVLGEDIEPCSMNPVTGWFRDGSCNTDKTDVGMHCVCAKVTDDFLVWCKENGNDLITPHPEFGFEGLKDGDNWCVCAILTKRAIDKGRGFKIYLRRTHLKTLELNPTPQRNLMWISNNSTFDILVLIPF